MTVRSRIAVRGAVALLALAAIAAAFGWLPFRPVLAVAAAAALLLAGEAWLALSDRRAPERPAMAAKRREALIDTSALIDGRLFDVAASGFLDLDLIVPGFVLRELQHVADAEEPLRRARGRRGLDVLAAMSAAAAGAVRVVEDDVPDLEVRNAILEHFKLRVVYVVRDGETVVIAIDHTSRGGSTWHARLTDDLYPEDQP